MTYRVLLERDSEGWWVASVPDVPGAHTQGRTIDQARQRIREALSLWVLDANRAQLEFDVHLPARVRARVERALHLREAAESTAREAMGATEQALDSLVQMGLSRRDTGDVLGISRQRAQQIAESLGARHRASDAKARPRTAARPAASSQTPKMKR